jgi:putative aminopeptidase FrvX
MSIINILEKTEEYLNIPSVVRFEEPFLEHLADDFNKGGYKIEKKDRILVVTKKGFKSPKIVTAHIDRHGIVFNKKGYFEYAAFNAKKHYNDKNKSSEEIFKKSGKRFIDEKVYAYDKNGKKLEGGIVKDFYYDFETKDLFFSIEGLGKLPQNTPIAYVSSLQKENNTISSQIDNVISVAVAHQLVEDGFDGTLLFTTEEEIGRSWKHIVDYLDSQDSLSKEIITLDSTPYNDTRAISEGLIVLRNKDENGVFNHSLINRIKEICENENIKYEMKDEFIEKQNAQLEKDKKPKKLGKTELGRIIQYTKGKFNSATVQIPTTNYHTNHETTSESSLTNYYKLLKKLI